MDLREGKKARPAAFMSITSETVCRRASFLISYQSYRCKLSAPSRHCARLAASDGCQTDIATEFPLFVDPAAPNSQALAADAAAAAD